MLGRGPLMSRELREPAGAPCVTCPYRQDAPSALWDESHYDLLPAYDNPFPEQPQNVFCCHKNDGRLCAGWVATHDMGSNLALRVRAITGGIDPAVFDACLDYESPVPVFGSGQEARDHGMRDYENPSARTRWFAQNLLARIPGVEA